MENDQIIPADVVMVDLVNTLKATRQQSSYVSLEQIYECIVEALEPEDRRVLGDYLKVTEINNDGKIAGVDFTDSLDKLNNL